MPSADDTAAVHCHEILDALSHPENGRTFAIMAPNGFGKTRLLRQVCDRIDWNRMSGLIPHDPIIDAFGSAKFIFVPASRELAEKPISIPRCDVSDVPELFELLLHMAVHGDSLYGGSDVWNAILPTAIAQFLEIDHRAADHHRSAILKWAETVAEQVTSSSANYVSKAEVSPKPSKPASVVQKFEEAVESVLGRRCRCSRNALLFECNRQQIAINEAPLGEFKSGALSFGERQILLISVLLFSSGSQQFVCIVDEPELHLNDARAIELWERMERQSPNVVFLYATHSVPFAYRPSIARTYLLDGQGTLVLAPKDKPLPQEWVHSIAGAQIQILRDARPAILCEDNALRFVLEDIFFEGNFQIVPIGGWEIVERATRDEQLWDAMRSRGIARCGVIDRDARDNHHVEEIEDDGIFCFPFYEAESILVVKEMALWMLSQAAGRSVLEDEYKAVLVAAAKATHHDTVERVAAYVADKHKPKIIPRLSRNQVRVETRVVKYPDKCEKEFDERALELTAAIENEDIEAIPRLFKGKLLYKRVAERSHGKGNSHLPAQLVIEPREKYNDIRDKSGFRRQLLNIPAVAEFKKKIVDYLSERQMSSNQ